MDELDGKSVLAKETPGPLLLTQINCTLSIHFNVWDEITYPFSNFNGETVEVSEWISKFTSLNCACDYLPIVGLQLMRVSKRGNRP